MPDLSEVILTLVPAPGERDWSTANRQAELWTVLQQLRADNTPVLPRVSQGNLIGEFSIWLSQLVESVVRAPLEAWIQKCPGRKVHLKAPGINAQAESPIAIEQLLTKVMALRQNDVSSSVMGLEGR